MEKPNESENSELEHSGNDETHSNDKTASKSDNDESNDTEPKKKMPKLDNDEENCEDDSDLDDDDLEVVLNEQYKDPVLFEQMQKCWAESQEFTEDKSGIKMYGEPFRICVLQNFLTDKRVTGYLVNEMEEDVEWHHKQMDLYEFDQSTDLSNIQTLYLKKFLQMLKTTVQPWLEKLCNLKLTSVSASCSMYNCGDYLLVHDDFLKDRQIAFVYYLSPWEEVDQWTDEMGGCLEIFKTDERCFPHFPVVRKFNPRNNQFVFFKVGSKSFHQVGEVTTSEYPRMTINGWFHGELNDDTVDEALRPIKKLDFTNPQALPIDLTNVINETYLTDDCKQHIQKHIEDNSEISLEEFLQPSLSERIAEDLKTSDSLVWTLKGPANDHRYEVLDMKSATDSIKQMVDIFSSAQMFKLLQEYTDLDLAEPNAKEPKISLEVQRWTPECYTVLGDSAHCDENTLDLMYFLNTTEDIGVTTYLSPEEENDSDYDESVLLTIIPKDNALNIVYRCEGTTKFTKYVSKLAPVENDKYRMYASVAFMVVVLIIGVPMWWKTTEVYRVTLPYSDIRDLSESAFQIKTTIRIFTFNPERSELLIKELLDAFSDSDVWNIKFEQIANVEGASNAKTPVALEATVLKRYPIKSGDFVFLEWPKLQEEILLTTDRSALIRSDTSSVKLQNVLNVYILQTHRIKAILTEDDEDRRVVHKGSPPQLQYDVVVSILNPQPEAIDVKWNVQLAATTYIEPFLKETSEISNFTLKTQWKYQIPFDGSLRQIRDSSKMGRHYALSETSMPHIITSIEKNLGTGITDNSVINMVVYVPPCEISPLHIYKGNNEMATRNKVDSFISPKWGGVIIFNPPEEVCLAYNENLEKVSFYVNTNDVMQIMLFQLHKLLDIHVEVTLAGVKAVDLAQTSPRTWEYDAFIRRSVANRIITSTHTLQSLIQLLDEISYIVINDDVGRDVNEAYENILLAKEYLKEGDLLQASAYSKKAFASSEKAFFDASLLAQLYFPDEQKYAIYIPLFLPIMVPVISSLSMIKKYYQAVKTGPKLKTD